MKKIHSHNSGTGREWKKTIPIIREREGNEKKAFPKFGNGKGMKKSIPIIRERESEAFILGNGREREFPLTPVLILIVAENNIVFEIEGQGLRSHWEVAKTGRELSAPVLNMLVVNLLFSFLTHFRFTDNQHDQGRGRASFAKIF